MQSDCIPFFIILQITRFQLTAHQLLYTKKYPYKKQEVHNGKTRGKG